ncbi:MAG: ABC transporter permease [bacterium]|nr:ABC transporter permease [bacterium]
MINLIKNELFKIFKKKSIYIILLITLGFIIFNNAMYKVMDNPNVYDNIYVNNIKEEIKTLDPNDDKQYYADLTSEIEIHDLKQEYGHNSWQAYVIDADISPIICEKNIYRYVEKDSTSLKNTEEKINKYLNLLNDDNWKNYAIDKLNEYKLELNNLKKQQLDQEILKAQEELLNKDIEKLELRIKKNIEYKDDYINLALMYYEPNIENFDKYNKNLINDLKDNYNEIEAKREYKNLAEDNAKYKYSIDNKVEVDNYSSTRYGIVNFMSEYSIFILIISTVISGSIVSTEFDKGTIKLLLVRPFKRNKILLSKLITSLLMIIFSIIIIFFLQLVVGGIFYGYDSLKIPAIIYNFNTSNIEYINVFKYSIQSIIASLPKFILLSTLGFAISTIINNSIVGVTIPIIGYFVAEIINALATYKNIKILKYFITLNWDLSKYLYGGIAEFSNLTPTYSFIVCIIYLIIIIIPTFIVFNKKNIKNI